MDEQQVEQCKQMGFALTNSLEQIQALVEDSLVKVKTPSEDLTSFIGVLNQIGVHIQEMSNILHQS